MTYSPELLKVERIYASALLGYTFRLGESLLGDSTSSRAELDVSSCSVTEGYSVGDIGELSLDPSTASIGFSERVTGVVTPTAPVRQHDAIEITYDEQLIFKGTVQTLNVSCEADDDYGKDYVRSWSASCSGTEALLLSTEASWSELPAETAYDRLNRWFGIDVSSLPEPHWPRLYVLQEPEDAGSASLLELARVFTEVTKLPVRLTAPFTNSRVLEILDTPIDWSDDPLTATTGYTGASAWVTSIEYENSEPTGLSVKSDDMRFIGFRSPDVIDAVGVPRPAARIQHSFGQKHYSVSIELAPRLQWTAGV